ncbi:spindle and centriole-associated protein 1 isoform X4 [Pungitius pungitius]|uniref:spindle and centriole-associated protein 1 isoform X4 n=1 Tax=Pungitius pungitius TaxID=134920 RepID=UPI002E0FB89E
MSFVRGGRPQQHKVKRPVRPKKAAAAPKRDWVSTVNDLSVHRASPAELNHRHEIHKSHNRAAAQWELREKDLQRRFRHAGSPAPLDDASLSIIREVFSDQLLLQDVLARSDRAMAVVKDLFGDAPRRQTGLPVLQRPDPPTQLSLLSQSLMDPQALNEIEASEEDYSDEDTCPTGSSDYDVIRRANVKKMKAQSRGRVVQRQKVNGANSKQAGRDNHPVTPCTSGRASAQAALNATMAVQRVRSRQSQSEEAMEEPAVLVSQVLNPDVPLNQSGRVSSQTMRGRNGVSQRSALDGSSVASLSGDQSSLGLLQTMLGQVEADLDTLIPATEPASAQSQKKDKAQGLTGFSVALVSTLGRLVHLLKQREEKAQEEARERRILEEVSREQRGLIDALTAETMTLREEAAALQSGLQQRTTELEQKLDTVVLLMGGLGLLEAPVDPPRDSDSRAAVCQSAPVDQRHSERVRVSASPAVLLSPPRQTDNWQQTPATHPVQLHRDPPGDILRSREDVHSHSSASSLTSLPLSSLPSSSSSLSPTSDPLGSQLSPGVMLAEIAQLTRQNNLIRAQFSRAKSRGSEVAEPSRGSNEQRRNSAGRVTPQNVGEGRMSASSSTGRRSRSVQAAEGEQVTNQATSPDSLHMSSVEQRLLELNRQSAAARGRLLELIEQQKQSTVASTSSSPIPPSAFSPHSAGGSPEASLLLPEEERLSQTRRRSAGSEVSSNSLGGEMRDGKTRQMEKRRERDGWFALSAHVR